MPFTYELRTIQKADLHRSEITPLAQELQEEHDAIMAKEVAQQDTEALRAQFDAKRKELAAAGHNFRITNNKIFEIYNDSGKTADVTIRFQVKGSVITWAFAGAPLDETYQSFRDELYNTAAKAHDNVEFGCERYYRGTNSYHLKTMHTAEEEYKWNHNHYRRKDGLPISPKEVREHLSAFVALPFGSKFFPDHSEVERVIELFGMYWEQWVDSNGVDPSPKERYERHSSQKLTDLDMKEEQANIHKQEPCRTPITPDMSPEEIERIRQQRIGSLDAGRSAALRQLDGSALPTFEKKGPRAADITGDAEAAPAYSGQHSYAGTLFPKKAAVAPQAEATNQERRLIVVPKKR